MWGDGPGISQGGQPHLHVAEPVPPHPVGVAVQAPTVWGEI